MGASAVASLAHRVESLGGKCAECDIFVFKNKKDRCAYCLLRTCDECRVTCTKCSDAVCGECSGAQRIMPCCYCGDDVCAECLGTKCILCEEHACKSCKTPCGSCAADVCEGCAESRCCHCFVCDAVVCEDCARDWLNDAPNREDEGREYEEYVCQACLNGNGARHHPGR